MIDYLTASDRHTVPGADRVALRCPDSNAPPLLYRDLAAARDGFAARLLAAGLRKGDVATVEIADHYLHALALIACAKLGIVTLSGYGIPAWLERRGAVRLVTGAVPAGPGRIVTVDGTWGAIQPPPEPVAWPGLSGSDPCRILLTSGSTGAAKPVLMNYHMVQTRIDRYASDFGPAFARGDGILCAMPFGSSLGYMLLFHALAHGRRYCTESTNFETMAAVITEESVPVVLASPFTLAEIVTYLDQVPGSRLPRVPLVLTTGARCTPDLAARVQRAFADELLCFYGTTEAGIVAVRHGHEAADLCGHTVSGQKVEIVGDDSHPVPDGTPGQVRISNRSGALTCFLDLDDPVPVMTFEPGDIGFLDPGHGLRLLGRADQVLNAGGSKIQADALEDLLSRAPGVLDCGVALETDAFGVGRVVCGFVRGSDWREARFLDFCQANIQPDFLPARFVLLDRIPRSPNRKIDRPALRAALSS